MKRTECLIVKHYDLHDIHFCDWHCLKNIDIEKLSSKISDNDPYIVKNSWPPKQTGIL